MTTKLYVPGGRMTALVLVLLLGCRPPESRGPANAAPAEKPVAAPAAPAPAAPPAPPPPAPPRKNTDWISSPRELAEQVLLGLREKDEELLDSLRVTEREYKE